ncbi:MAG: hypothetical protein ABEJ58_09685 [Halodesulfurarchaeum sp.]
MSVVRWHRTRTDERLNRPVHESAIMDRQKLMALFLALLMLGSVLAYTISFF